MPPYKLLEQKYADFVGSRFAVSCNSGTAALHLALLSLGVGPGDEVILPDFTMAACGFAVTYCGAKPVFVDVDDQSYGLRPDLVEAAITPSTKAIMVVHVYGRLSDTAAILRIARRRRIRVIEDACEAQGAIFNSCADVTIYSFYQNKIIAAEEGGMVTTNDAHIAKRCEFLKNMAFGPKHDYFHKEIGFNYRLPNAQAEIALKSLQNYPKNAKKRRQVEEWYTEHLIQWMTNRDAVWFYEMFVPAKAKKEILRQIPGARDSFKPLSSFPMYGSVKKDSIASKLSKSLVLLPVSTQMSELDVKNISTIVNKYA